MMCQADQLASEDAVSPSALQSGASGKERPILFSAPMVRAILAGNKTQTRRILKPQPPAKATMFRSGLGKYIWDWPGAGVGSDDGKELPRVRVAKGDTLWVRETWSGLYRYADLKPRDMGSPFWYWADGDPTKGDWTSPKPSIHMPRWASRITLAVTDVRVQRLQDISEEDAKAEGAILRHRCSGFGAAHDGWSMDWSRVGQPSRFHPSGALTESCLSLQSPRFAFASYWNEINGSNAWDANPWVYAVSFSSAPTSSEEAALPADTASPLAEPGA